MREQNKILVDKEKVRMMVLDLGYTETSQRLNIKRDTLYQWAKRYYWNTPITHAQETVRTVRPVSDAHAEAMADLKKQTKLSLAKYSAKAAKDSESATLRDSPLVHKVAQVASLVWPEEQKPNSILNLGLLIGTEEREKVITLPNTVSEG